MKEKHTIARKRAKAKLGKTGWRRLATLSEKEIIEAARSDIDAQPTDLEFWKGARLVMPVGKQPVTLRVDKDVLAWFRAQGRRYQSRMNAVLRSFMRAHRKAG